MDYKVKFSDINGDISGFPIEVIQAAVERGVVQGRTPEDSISSLQYYRCSGFTWRDTPEGHHFWSKVMDDRNFAVFFQRFPRSIEDGVYYFRVYTEIVTPTHPVMRIRAYTRNVNKLAQKANVGDLYYMVVKGDDIKVGFALLDSAKYRKIISLGTEIK